MSVWTDAFIAAYDPSPDWSSLATLMSTRTGKTVTEAWLQANLDEAFGHVMYYASCQDTGDSETGWANPGDLPDRVASVLVSLLARATSNPEGVRTIQLGEFSQTWAGSVGGPDGPVTPKEQLIIGRIAGCPGGIVSVETVSPPILGNDPRIG